MRANHPILIPIVVASIVGLSACSQGPTPAEVVQSYMGATYAEDWQTAYDLLDPELQKRLPYQIFAQVNGEPYQQARFIHAELEVVKEEIAGDEATLRVRITHPDLDQIRAQAIEQVPTGLFRGPDPLAVEEAVLSLLQQEEVPLRRDSQDLELVRAKGEWRLVTPVFLGSTQEFAAAGKSRAGTPDVEAARARANDAYVQEFTRQVVSATEAFLMAHTDNEVSDLVGSDQAGATGACARGPAAATPPPRGQEGYNNLANYGLPYPFPEAVDRDSGYGSEGCQIHSDGHGGYAASAQSVTGKIQGLYNGRMVTFSVTPPTDPKEWSSY